MTTARTHLSRFLAILLVLVVLVACGDDADDETNPPPEAPSVQATQSATSAPTGTPSTPESLEITVETSADDDGTAAPDAGAPDDAEPPSSEVASAVSPPPTAVVDGSTEIQPYSGDVDSVDPTTFDEDGNGDFTAEEMTNAIRAIYAYYVWPPDYYVTVETIVAQSSTTATLPDGQQVGVHYAIEDFRGAIDVRHHCAWILQWGHYYELGETELADQVLDVLVITTEDGAMAEYDKGRFQDWINQARLGDVSMIMLFVEEPGMCSGWTWDSPPPSSPTSNDPSSPVAVMPSRLSTTEVAAT